MVAAMLFSFASAPAFAIIYQPGQTLNPTCLPTDMNCGVTPSVSIATSTPGLAAGSLIYLQAVTASSTSWLAIPVGTNGQMLTITGGTPAWSTLFMATTTINGVSGPAFTFGTSMTGTDFSISTSTNALTFNLPSATSTARGLLTAVDWTAFNNKISSQWTTSSSNIYYNSGNVGIGTTTPAYKLEIDGTSSLSDRTIGINGTPILYLPDQTSNNIGGSLAMGDGLRNLSHVSGFDGQLNTAAGLGALNANTTGYQNTALGWSALSGNTTGNLNVAVGDEALKNNATGTQNVAIGHQSLKSNSGSSNTAVGSFTLNINTTGGGNNAFGGGALLSNTTGSSNVAVGSSALVVNATGSDNVALGNNALFLNTGNNNIAVGRGAGNNITTGSNNIVIGYYSGAPSASASNQLNIGNLIFGTGLDATSTAISSGNIGIGTTAPNNRLAVNGAITLASSTPLTTAGALYNQGNTLYWNGSALGGSSQWTTSGANIYYNTGNVGVGTTTPSAKLAVVGPASLAQTNPGLNSGNGTVTTVGTDTVITYTSTSTSTFTPPTGVTSVQYLVVAGGGGGGRYGGGGGAGGMATGTLSVSGAVTVTVGGGGTGSASRNTRGVNGSDSVFSTITATGGGGGGSDNTAVASTTINTGAAGGSGGGGSYLLSSAGGAGNTPPLTPSQGNNGGAGFASANTASGGGGGASATGGAAGDGVNGAGGNGASSSISGSSVTYAGGGGGAGGVSGGAGGTGGGGGGGVAGTANTGGGGGGNGAAAGSNGGSGVVIVRFTTQNTILTPILRVTDTGTNASTTLAIFENSFGMNCIIQGQTASLTCSSDVSLKKNIETMDNGVLSNVLALNPVNFDWKLGTNGNDYNADGTMKRGSEVGFIAQDVEKLFPGLVTTDANGKKALAYDRFAPIIVKTIQEQFGGLQGLTISTSTIPEMFSSTTTLDQLASAGAATTSISDPIGYIRSLVQSGIKIAHTLVSEKIVAVQGYFRRIFANELCLSDSDGKQVCITGNQLKNIGGSVVTTLIQMSSQPNSSTSTPTSATDLTPLTNSGQTSSPQAATSTLVAPQSIPVTTNTTTASSTDNATTSTAGASTVLHVNATPQATSTLTNGAASSNTTPVPTSKSVPAPVVTNPSSVLVLTPTSTPTPELPAQPAPPAVNPVIKK